MEILPKNKSKINPNERQFSNLKSILKKNKSNLQISPKTVHHEEDLIIEASVLSKSSSQALQYLDFNKLARDVNSESQKSPYPELDQILSSQGLSNVWKERSLNILYYVSKFIRQIKTSGNKIKFKQLTTRILDIISDHGSDSQKLLEYKDILNNIAQSAKKLKAEQLFSIFSLIPVIEPNSVMKIVWDIFVLVAIIINLFFIPLDLGFNFDADPQIIIWLNTIPQWLFLIDVLFTLQTAYYHEGTIHRNKGKILKNYIKDGKLLIDVLIILPVLFSSMNISVFKFATLIRIFRLPKMVANLEEVINPKESIMMIMQLGKLIYFIIITCHFCACIWGFLGELQITENNNSWLIHYGIDNAPWATKYIFSIYYCTITTLTIGYGDITPQTDLERVYSILLALLVCGILGYSVSTVGNIIKQLQDKEEQFKAKLSVLTNYMKSRHLNQQLQLQVRKYFEHYIMLEQESQFEAEQMMQQLTKDLKEKVAIDLYFKILKQSKVLQNLCEDCLNKLCLYVHEKKLVPEEKVWSTEEQGTRMYFLIKGELAVMANNICLRNYESGVFGEREFVTLSQYQTSLKAVKFSQLIYFNMEDLMKILYEHQNDLERFRMLQDNCLFNDNYKNFGQVCQICGWTHQLNSCPFVFVKVNRNKLITSVKDSKPQNRFYHDRKYYSFKTMYSLKDCQECGLAFMINEKYVEQIDCSEQYLMDLGFNISKDEIDEDNQPSTNKQKQYQDSKFESFSKSNTFTDYFKQNEQSVYEQTNKNTNKNTNKPKSILQNNNKYTHESLQQTSQQQSSLLQTSIQQMNSKDQQQSLHSPTGVKWDNENIKQNNKKSTLILRKIDKERSVKIEMRLNNKSKPSYVSTIRQETSNNKSMVRFDSSVSGKMTKSVHQTTNNVSSMVSPYDDMLNMFQDDQLINQENVDFNIDKQFIMTEYYPFFNFDVIIKKFDKSLQNRKSKIFATISRGKTLKRYIK